MKLDDFVGDKKRATNPASMATRSIECMDLSQLQCHTITCQLGIPLHMHYQCTTRLDAREAGIACIAHRLSFFCAIFCNIQKVFKKILNFPVVLFFCFEKKKLKKIKIYQAKKEKPKKNPKENTDCMRYMSHKVCTGICVVCFVVTNYWSGLTWPGCWSCWCCWWSES